MQTELVLDFLKRNELLTVEAFAELVGWTAETERQMRSRGKTPANVRIKRKTLYRYADVAEWLMSQRVENVGDAVSSAILRQRGIAK